MCGIVAYLGNNNAYEIIIKGLQRLEYRGYDSAGIALHNEKNISVYKQKGKVKDLEDFVAEKDISGKLGIGHTRWATHGLPNNTNAHPHQSGNKKISLVHNGIIENFLDMSHFPFVHIDVLGAEPETEVNNYKVNLRKDVNELWATECGFYQPKAMASATEGIEVDYQYRVANPFAAILYKTCPGRDDAMDLVGILPQPLDETNCDIHYFMLVFDDVNSDQELIQFQQGILMQDRIILENQRPRELPLERGAEITIRADAASIQYRRWIKDMGIGFGTL